MSPSAYLADLRHDYSGVLSTDCMPLGVSYLKSVLDRDVTELQSKVFAYPVDLLESMRAHPPDVLMLSNYVWNEQLSLLFFQLARQINPDVLTIMGGPNLPLDEDRQIDYLRNHPEVDIYVLGEGEFIAAEILSRFLDSGLCRNRLLGSDLPSSLYRRDGEVVRNLMWERKKEVDEIPSPWLLGIQDHFFDGKLAPMIETNRGCPFTCTFCVQGERWYTKVHYFGRERIMDELTYIARMIRSRSPNMGTLRIADSNYGMFERDVEYSEHIGRLQKDYGWPTFIDATTGKNRADRIIRSVEKAGGALVLYQAVQSLDESVLRNVKRSTIKLEAYEQLLVHIRGRGLRTVSDLILGLPGETLESHLRAVRHLVDTGVNEVHNFQCMMLKGSELEKAESRRMFSFETRFRVLPKNFGDYGDRRVVDLEEIVVATETLRFEDYVKARKYALASSVFWNDGWFEEAVRFVQKLGAARSACWAAMLPAMERAEGSVRALLEDFVRETVGELFPTREACIEFYLRPENFKRLCDGEIGDNLMYKYRAKASFHYWKEICAVGMSALRELAVSCDARQKIDRFDDLWEELTRYVELRHADGKDEASILSPARTSFHYDIAAWIADGTPFDTEPYRSHQARPYLFRLSEESAHEFEAALKVWTTNLKGLTKLVTRIQLAWQVRACMAETEAVAYN
jgi:radical SAM superfamily enzyme YgiQ (UPF0313 family)